jgi:acyl transferase domain-containing protein
MKERVVVVCPGRGTYTKESLGYLKAPSKKYPGFISAIDERRRSLGFPTVTELDSALSFQPQLHTLGEHASPLIYACSATDFFSIDKERFDIVAITGNSMGWYTTLALAGALGEHGDMELIQTMGSMMMSGILGGQVIYPIHHQDWTLDHEIRTAVLTTIQDIHGSQGAELYVSIELGGYLVIGGNQVGISRLMKALPKVEHFPFQLINHAAFHTPLLQTVSENALESIGLDLFRPPQIPMVDGRGKIWQPFSSDVNELRNYTLIDQVLQTYSFTKAIEVTIKEFAPTRLVLLGPGNSLGSATAQVLINLAWQGLRSKSEFVERQKTAPFVLSFGRPEQRAVLG